MVELDTTAKTNRFKMPLVAVIGIDEAKNVRLHFKSSWWKTEWFEPMNACLQNVPFAWALLSTELTEDFEFVLKFVRAAVPTWTQKHIAPVIFSDGDQAIAAAIRSIVPEAVHRLCRWHLARNITEQLKATMGTEFAAYLTAFYRAADAVTHDEFDARWIELETIAEKSTKAMSYTKSLHTRAPSFAVYAIRGIFTAGVTSTQRVESVNALIKRMASVGTTLPELRQVLEAIELHPANAVKRRTIPSFLRAAAIEKQLETLAPAIMADIIGQCEEVLGYRPLQNKVYKIDGTLSATIDANGACSCAYPSSHGLPCRHIFAWRAHHGMLLLRDEDVAQRWKPSTPVQVAPKTTPKANEPAATQAPATDTARFAALQPLAKSVVDLGQRNKTAYTVAHQGLRTLLDDVRKATTTQGMPLLTMSCAQSC